MSTLHDTATASQAATDQTFADIRETSRQTTADEQAWLDSPESHHDKAFPPARPFTPADLEPLKWFLYDHHYAMVERYRILDYAAEHRTLAGVIANQTLDREDEAAAYAVLETCFPPVGQDPWDWDLMSEMDTWSLGPAIPVAAILTPPGRDSVPADLSDEVLAAYWPGGES
jgi:hypothetical protein